MSSPEYYGLHLKIEDQVAWVYFDRPDNANSVDLLLAQSLLAVSHALEADDSVRVVVLSGKGRFFCAGGDLDAIYSAPSGVSAELRAITAAMHAAISVLMRMEKPLVTAINGPAAGAGVSLSALGDIAIARESATFKTAFTAIGLSPDCATTWVLPRLLGVRRAQELLLTNRPITAPEACDMDLVTRVVPDDAFDAEVASLVQQLASGPTRAFGATRRLMHQTFSNSVEQQMTLEGESLALMGASRDAQEGIAAFLTKSKPGYTGQ